MKAMRRLLPILFLLALSACGGEIEPGRTPAAPAVIKGLVLEQIVPVAVPGAATFVGTVESLDRGLVGARIDGRVAQIAVAEGALVKPGQLLLILEQNTAAARLSEAQSQREAAAASLQLAEKTFARYQQLFLAEAVTPQEMDRVAADLELARQQQRGAEAGVQQARTAASYCRVTAPYAARVIRREVEVGTTVQPGTPLLVLDRQGGWRVRLEVPDSRLGSLALGDPLTVEIPALRRTLAGTVAEIVPQSDPLSRTVQVKVDLQGAENLTPGLYARAFRATETSATLLVPAAAVVHRGQLTGLYVVEQGLLRYRLVRTGRTLGERVEVLSGLEAGETVVVEGTARAKNGARVEG